MRSCLPRILWNVLLHTTCVLLWQHAIFLVFFTRPFHPLEGYSKHVRKAFVYFHRIYMAQVDANPLLSHEQLTVACLAILSYEDEQACNTH